MKPILVTGATGYIGGRLIPRLLLAGFPVRVLVRDPSRLQGRPWLSQVEVVQGDALDTTSLASALQGVSAAFYLIHSMSKDKDFHQRDLTAAQNFSNISKSSGLERIVYMGGLGNPMHSLSPHLRSRQQVGRILARSGIPLIEFQAAVIIGSGSASFEMMRYPVEGMPVLLCPPWVNTYIQPISVHDVLDYLVAALSLHRQVIGAHRIVEIGGADVLTYHDMMHGYAHARGLHRVLLRLPYLPVPICATFLHLVTPIPASLAYALIEGMRNEVVVRDDSAKELFPTIHPRGYTTSLERALARLTTDQVETTWSDAQFSATGDVIPVSLTTREGLLIEQRQRLVSAPVENAFHVITSLGGKRGWLYLDWVWQVRGAIDRLVGGVGFRRGRRHPRELRVGDALDFWRVEALETNHLLRLRAEMKVPGLAWLQFELIPKENGGCLIVQTAFFEPKGLPGLLYWYLLYPIHGFIFSGMIRQIACRAQSLADGE